MKDNAIVAKSFTFALQIIESYRLLVEQKREYVLSKQLLRSGTSIGANVNEAVDAQSAADFIHKMSISLKEARETHYWLRLLSESQYIDSHNSLIDKCEELIRILTAIVKTSKENAKKQ